MSAIGPAPAIYLITDRHTQATPGRPLGAVVAAALRALPRMRIPPAAVAVQLREPGLEGRALLALARELRAVTAAAGVRLFVNDRVDVALAAGADGVHLGGASLIASDVETIGPHLQIARSTHTVEEVERSAADGRCSFVVFGPVYDTPSKRQYGPPLGLPALARAAAAARVPVLAIGGVELERIKECRRAGARGIACIRAILANSDPESALKAFFETIEST